MRNAAMIAAVLFASSGFAYAEDIATVVAPSPSVRHVGYQPSDLATDSGIRDLRSRVRSAANELCEPSDDAFIVTYNRLDCVSPTLRDAFAQVDRAVERWRGGAQASAGRIVVRVR